MEIGSGASHQARHNDQSSSIEQGAKNLPDGEIECVRMEQSPHVARIESKPVSRLGEQTSHVCVAYDHALGPAGRTGCVNHICRVIWFIERWQFANRFRGHGRQVAVHEHNLPR